MFLLILPGPADSLPSLNQQIKGSFLYLKSIARS